MHEAGIAERALDAVLAAAPADGSGPPSAISLRVTDPAHLDAEAVALHLEIALAERGWGAVPVAISVDSVDCPACGAATRPEGEWPFCPTCGAPLPEVAGSGIEIGATW